MSRELPTIQVFIGVITLVCIRAKEIGAEKAIEEIEAILRLNPEMSDNIDGKDKDFNKLGKKAYLNILKQVAVSLGISGIVDD